MRRLAGWLALAGLALASPAQAQTWREVMALGKPDPTVLREDGVEARIEHIKIIAANENCGRSAAEVDVFGNEVVPKECANSSSDYVGVTVTFPGSDPQELPPDELRNDAYPISVGIGPMASGDGAAVIVEGTSGGPHCCATFQMMAVVDGAVVALSLPPMDGSPGTAFPTDIDGDGTVDIRRSDDAFLYSFSSYAASVPIPKIYNLQGGQFVDVSAEPRYAQVWHELAEEALPLCADQDASERGGACAAYAAAKARLGEPEEGIATAVRNAGTPDWLPEPCTVEVTKDGCPGDKVRHFASYEEALRWMLQDRGYLGGPSAIPYLKLDPPAGFDPLPDGSQPPVDGPAPVGHEESVGLAEVPAPQEP